MSTKKGNPDMNRQPIESYDARLSIDILFMILGAPLPIL
jgi:hypothetical protein